MIAAQGGGALASAVADESSLAPLERQPENIGPDGAGANGQRLRVSGGSL